MAKVKEKHGPRPMEKLAKILHAEVNKGEIVIPAEKLKSVDFKSLPFCSSCRRGQDYVQGVQIKGS
ncbi:MAG: hypothetical protein ACI35Q_03965 [Marinilabiliaceae bacterium]